jgi:hypothetical protein
VSEDRGAPLSKTKARWLVAPAALASAFYIPVDPDQRGTGGVEMPPLFAEDRRRRTRAVSPYDSFVVQPRSVPDMRRAMGASDSTSLFGPLPRFRDRRRPSSGEGTTRWSRQSECPTLPALTCSMRASARRCSAPHEPVCSFDALLARPRFPRRLARLTSPASKMGFRVPFCSWAQGR